MAWDKAVSQKEAVKAFLVAVDGGIDIDASVAKYRAAALKYLTKQEQLDTLVMTALNELFDTFRGANLNLEFIKSQVFNKIGSTHPELNDPTLFASLADRVETILNENTNRPAREAKGDKPAVPAVEGKAYGVKQGVGFWRECDKKA